MEQNYIDFIGKFFAGIATFVTTAGIRLVLSLILVVVGFAVVNRVIKDIKQSKRCEKTDKSVLTFVTSFASISLKILIILTAASYLGVPMTNLVAIVGSCGLAIGLALQGALGNLAGGIMILIFKPFKVDDYITTSSVSGTVSNITIMYTVLKTPDNKVITIPNGTLTNSVIENYSTSDKRRVDLIFTAGYECDTDKVKEILISTINKHEKILKDPEPFARLTNCGDSAVEYTVRVWCDAADFWDVKFDLLESVKKEFDANGISIPYPQMDVHINNK